MRYLLSILAFSLASLGISQPAQVQVNADCLIQFNITTSGGTVPSTGGFANGVIGCNSWQIQYWNQGFSAITLAVQSAPNTATSPTVCTPGAWGTIGGTLTFGINPNTNTTGASSLIQSYGTNFASCVRVALTSATGSGNVTGVLLGYRAAGTAGTSTSATSNVNATNFPTTVDTNEGNPTASTIRDIPASMGTILSGQQAVTGSAAALATNTINNLCVEALSTNTGSIFIGPSGVTTATGLELKAGAAWCSSISNSNLVFVIASGAGPTVTWIATK